MWVTQWSQNLYIGFIFSVFSISTQVMKKRYSTRWFYMVWAIIPLETWTYHREPISNAFLSWHTILSCVFGNLRIVSSIYFSTWKIKSNCVVFKNIKESILRNWQFLLLWIYWSYYDSVVGDVLSLNTDVIMSKRSCCKHVIIQQIMPWIYDSSSNSTCLKSGPIFIHYGTYTY